MATAQSDLLSNAVATATAGLAGGPSLNRSTVDGAYQQTKIAHFTIPASGAGSASGDVIQVAVFNVFARIFAVTVFHTAGGSGVTLDIGKSDPNNSSNTDATHYATGVDISLAGSFVAGGVNIGEQIGADPSGAVTDTGNGVPYFGEPPVIMTATIHGTPTAAAVIAIMVEYTERP